MNGPTDAARAEIQRLIGKLSDIHSVVVDTADEIAGLQPVTDDTLELVAAISGAHFKLRMELTNYDQLLHNDLHAAKATIIPMNPLALSAQMLANMFEETDVTTLPADLHAPIAAFVELARQYEKACADAANATEPEVAADQAGAEIAHEVVPPREFGDDPDNPF